MPGISANDRETNDDELTRLGAELKSQPSIDIGTAINDENHDLSVDQ